MKLSAPCAGRPLPPGRFVVLISVRGRVDPRAIVRLQGLGQLKNPMTSSEIEHATFRLVAQCLKQLRYRVPRVVHDNIIIVIFIIKLAEMPGVARVDHRTKCVSLVAISLSQNFETRNCWPA
jgi:hypothetical protein